MQPTSIAFRQQIREIEPTPNGWRQIENTGLTLDITYDCGITAHIDVPRHAAAQFRDTLSPALGLAQ
ncbi:hypothetical protein HNP84_000215 [Thermocatellispora tengchongensis]|uniref:Uncharacterized protein n=1 Tax=Thermocatellispora tengchongensis TaxID=1073253 RepID=A0A840NZU5_9ACTN|nr:hypothetical protein [Thermocatellispora tengchongensis]MBB5130527.1 hypothetical protein [Thermocatellispora tengchongensis]